MSTRDIYERIIVKYNPYHWNGDRHEFINYEASKSINFKAANELANLMLGMSLVICDSWDEEVEIALWNVCVGTIQEWKNYTFSQGEIQELRSLSNQSDGWWLWWDGLRFVRLEQWKEVGDRLLE